MSDQNEAQLQKTRDVVAETIAAQIAENEANPDIPTADASEVEASGWDEYTVDELKDELANRDLPVSGNKAELIARLEEDDA